MADFRSTKTCAEIDEILNNAVLVGNDGDDGTKNTLLGLKKGLTSEINGKQNTILDLDDIRNKSKSAVQPTDLSAVATSGSYNDLSNKPVYITPFTVADLEDIIGDSEQSIDIRIDFIDAIVAKKVILIPNSSLVGGGYIVATNIDGYKGDIDAGAHLEFWVAKNRFVLDIDNSINDDSTITITGADISIEGIPDWTSIERKLEYYRTNFTIQDIVNLLNGNIDSVRISSDILNAVQKNKAILIPEESDEEDGSAGYYIATYASVYKEYGDWELYLNFWYNGKMHRIEVAGGDVNSMSMRKGNIEVIDYVVADELEDIQQSDYDESDSTSKAYIKNRTHYFRGYTSAQQLVADDTTIGTNLANVGEYFKLGNTVYKSADMVGVEFNCQTSGAPVYVSVVSDVNANGDVVYYLKHISGSSSSGAPIMFITAGEFKALDAVYIPDSFATKDYVETQIRAVQKEVVSISTPTIESLQPNKIYVNHSGRLSNLTISSLETTTSLIDEYTLHFGTSGAGLLYLPDYVKWANGEKPTLAAGAVYELSIVKTTISGTDYFKAVLTRFA